MRRGNTRLRGRRADAQRGSGVRHYEAASDIVADGQQNTPAASGAVHRSGKSCVQVVKLANIVAYVLARIALANYQGEHPEDSNQKICCL